MKIKTPLIISVAVGSLLVSLQTAPAQGTLFTYQGRLNTNTVPANGLFDFEFSLYNGASGPPGATQIGSSLTNIGVGVTNGLFTTAIDFGDIFTGEPVWLALGVRSNGAAIFTPITPLQELTPSPYAIFADTASNLSGTLAVGQLNGILLPAQLPGTVVMNNESGVTLDNMTVGGTLSLPEPASIRAGGSSLLYADANYNFFAGLNAGNTSLTGSGNTAVGDDAFAFSSSGQFNSAQGFEALFDNGLGSFNTASGAFALQYNTTGSNNTATGAYALSAYNVPLFVVGGGNTADGAYALAGDENGYNNTAVGYLALNANTNGYDNVAVGVDALEVLNSGSLNYQNTAVGNYSMPSMTTGYQNTGIGDYSFYTLTNGGFNLGLGLYAGYYLNSGSDNIYIGNYGVQGDNNTIRIGESPSATYINGTATYLTGSETYVDGVLALDGSDTNNGLVYTYASGLPGIDPGGNGVFLYGFNGGALGTVFPNEVNLSWDYSGNVWVSNNLSTLSLTIRGGSDLAEPFKITSGKDETPDGSVVVIDEENPGHLKMSSQPYDTRVAGILSGANGVHPGIQMQQQGLLEGDRNVALTGRVYVQADASNGPIRPGDLLTTSSTPGRAMKVTDHVRAQGAILGKAMSGLAEGNGMVLVLVTLQ
jgi:hypothetical protein